MNLCQVFVRFAKLILEIPYFPIGRTQISIEKIKALTHPLLYRGGKFSQEERINGLLKVGSVRVAGELSRSVGIKEVKACKVFAELVPFNVVTAIPRAISISIDL